MSQVVGNIVSEWTQIFGLVLLTKRYSDKDLGKVSAHSPAREECGAVRDDHRPPRLVIVDTGAIGLEMSGAFSDFGADVTVIGQDSKILPTLDADIAGYVGKILESRRVTFHLGARSRASLEDEVP